jgi:hypothetical protein
VDSSEVDNLEEDISFGLEVDEEEDYSNSPKTVARKTFQS